MRDIRIQIKRVLFLSLALGVGFSNWVFAAGPDCAGMIERPQYTCCGSAGSCECSIQVPSNDLSEPARFTTTNPGQSAVSLPASSVSPIFFQEFQVQTYSPKSPPAPLYQLYSILRI